MRWKANRAAERIPTGPSRTAPVNAIMVPVVTRNVRIGITRVVIIQAVMKIRAARLVRRHGPVAEV